MGCNLVVTEKGDTRFYFGAHAEYVDPVSVPSIASGIERALHRRRENHLIQQIKSNFSWEVAAQQTLDGYNKALQAQGK